MSTAKKRDQKPESYRPKEKPEIISMAETRNKILEEAEMAEPNNPAVITFKTQLDEFLFLGIENLVTENADFGAFWGNFFDKGGYDKIAPYQKDPNSINVWYMKTPTEKIYYQGMIVNKVDEVPEGYTLTKFPASEYLVATTEWLSSYEETMNHIDHSYYQNAQIPAGYAKCDENDNKLYLIERWGAKTQDGYRYEFWVPIKKVD